VRGESEHEEGKAENQAVKLLPMKGEEGSTLNGMGTFG
jgi:hypothetical protein